MGEEHKEKILTLKYIFYSCTINYYIKIAFQNWYYKIL